MTHTRGDVREGLDSLLLIEEVKDLETKKATVARRSTQEHVKKRRVIIWEEFKTEALSKSGRLHS